MRHNEEGSNASDQNAKSTQSRTHMTDLPPELLKLIILHLDRASARSLSLVSRVFTAACVAQYWKELPLFVGPESELPPGVTNAKLSGHNVWDVDEERHRLTSERTSAIKKSGNDERLKYVKGIKAVVFPGQNSGLAKQIVGVLKLSSKSLQMLDIRTPGRARLYSSSIGYIDRQIFEYGPKLSFPSLTRVVLGKYSILDVGFIPFLCQYSPNITHLDFAVENNNQPLIFGPHSPPRERKFVRTTKITHLRIHCYDDQDPSVCDEEPTDHCGPTVAALLKDSPLIRQLQLDYEPVEDITQLEIGDALHYLQELKSFAWAGMMGFPISEDESDLHMPSVTRLVVGVHGFKLPTDHYHNFPSIDTIWFDASARPDWSFEIDGSTAFPSEPSIQTLPPKFAQWLKCHPNIRTIGWFSEAQEEYMDDYSDHLGLFSRLDAIEASRKVGSVRSFGNGEDELLLVRLLVQESDTRASSSCSPSSNRSSSPLTPPPALPKQNRVIYTIGPESRAYNAVAEPVFQCFFDLNGNAVSLESIRRMKEIDGITSKGAEDGRNTVVSDRAWAALTSDTV